jgi:type II secretory pathway pseudopilin PulG
MTARKGGRLRGERGDTLVEILVAVTILGIAFVAILAGLATTIRLSGQQRGRTNADTVLVGAADSVKNQTYVSCPTASASSYTPTSGVTLPSGWSASNVTMTIKYRDTNTWSATCPSTDQNVQLLTITAAAPDGKSSESVEVVKRRAS